MRWWGLLPLSAAEAQEYWRGRDENSGNTGGGRIKDDGRGEEGNERSVKDPGKAFETLIAEAGKGGKGKSEAEIEANARRALECPCVSDLRKGPCGHVFSEAFICFFKSTAPEKGSDCGKYFAVMQSCIGANAEHFKKYLEDEEDEHVLNSHR